MKFLPKHLKSWRNRLAALCLFCLVIPHFAQAQCSNVTLSTQAQVNAFTCTTVSGTLTILGADITDLSPLSALTSVGGDLLIFLNNKLVNLDGLSALTTVGGRLEIYSNPILADLDGLSALTTVGGALVINVSILVDLDGLSALTTVGGDLRIESNGVLTDCCGIYGLLESGGVSGTITISNNDTGCDNETEVIEVCSCDAPEAMCQAFTAVLVGSSVSIEAANVDGGSTADCGLSGLAISRSQFDCSHVGIPQTVTLTITDINNLSSECTATVTVEDNLPPYVQCKNINKALGNGPGGNVTLLPSEVNNFSTDNCGGTGGVTLVSVSPNSFSCSSSPVQTVTLTVKDAQNLTNTCSASVNIVDLTDPVAVCQSATIQLDGSGNASLTPAEVDGGSSDNCGITLMSVFPNTFTCANVGANNVTLTVEDAFGGKHSCLALVDVQDTTSPTVICPADITADVDAGICCATLTIDAPTVSDNCTTLNFTNDRNGSNDASGIYFPGETILNWTATDGLGNTFTCVQSVTVEDNEAPVLGYTDEVCYAEYEVCLEEQAAYTAEQLAELEIFIANCNGDPACLQEAERIALGIDEGSRKYMSICLFILNGCDVIPAANNQLPDIVVEAPVGSCEIELNPGPVVMENCATFTLTNDYNSNGTGEGTYPVGTTVVTWTAVDQYGNTSTVSRSITVIGVGDADCDGVTDGCDICPDGDDSVDANGDGIPDCSQLLSYEDYSEDWKCGNNKIYISHNGETNCINKNALPAHFNHGDAIGPYQSCPQSLVAPTGGGNHEHGHVVHSELTLSPNPASHEINIHFNRHAPQATLQITDVLGRIVFTKELAEGVDRTVIDLGNGNFENGIYQVSLSENGETTTKQLVILR